MPIVPGERLIDNLFREVIKGTLHLICRNRGVTPLLLTSLTAYLESPLKSGRLDYRLHVRDYLRSVPIRETTSRRYDPDSGNYTSLVGLDPVVIRFTVKRKAITGISPSSHQRVN
jgi:hypothetical protein